MKVRLIASCQNHLSVFEGEGERFSAEIPVKCREIGKEYEATFDPLTRRAEIEYVLTKKESCCCSCHKE